MAQRLLDVLNRYVWVMKTLDSEQARQERQYGYPYHYIPIWTEGEFSQVHAWSWGMNYLGGIELILSTLKGIRFRSLLDVGCGDGRFLREVSRRYQGVQLLGLDYSQNAINLASAMNPGIDYVCRDLREESLPYKFDVATMIEVLEHIPTYDVSEFLRAVRAALDPDGTLLLTVPHENKKVNEKHYQHFSSQRLADCLGESFDVRAVVPFDRVSRLNGSLLKLLGYRGGSYIITNKRINAWLYRRILKGCLDKQPEEKCGRLLAVASPK